MEETMTFEDLYTECFLGIYRFIYVRVQDMKTAEDITSRTFLKALRRWPPRCTTGHVPKAWLFKIARNLIIDHYRSANRHPIVSLDKVGVPDQADNPGSDTGLNILNIKIAFTSLSSRDQELLSLRLAGQSNKEIASILGISKDAAGKACLRALKRLREKVMEGP